MSSLIVGVLFVHGEEWAGGATDPNDRISERVFIGILAGLAAMSVVALVRTLSEATVARG